jgi:hypothetical protein
MNNGERFKALLNRPILMAILLSLISLICYIAPLHSWNCEDTGGDSGAAELLPIAILEYHALDFDELVKNHPSLLSDNALPYYLMKRNDRTVSFYPIIPGLMNLPTHIVARSLGVDLFRYRARLSMVTSALVCSLSVGFMYLALCAACSSPLVAAGFALFHALGTEIWSQLSHTLWQHGPSLLLLNAALAIILRGRARHVGICGLLFGFAVWNRTTNVLIVGPLVIYLMFKHREQIVSLLFALAVPISTLLLYSHVYCGSVLYLGQGESPLRAVSEGGGLRGDLLSGLSGLLLSPNRGLLFFDPVFLAGFVFLGFACFSISVSWVYKWMAVGTVLTLFVYGRWTEWWGGWCFGYRLVSELVPILTLASALAWERWLCRLSALRWAFGLAAAFSFYVNGLGALYYPISEFNFVPASIDDSPARLWRLRDGELARDQRLLLADLGGIFRGQLPFAWPRQVPTEPALPDLANPKNTQSLPLGFGGKATQGGLEVVTNEVIAGFAFDPDQPDARLGLCIYDGDQPLMIIRADLYRDDLKSAGMGDGKYSFNIPTPSSLQDGKTHQIWVKILGSNAVLGGSPMQLN